MDHLSLLRKSFSQKVLNFHFGPDDPLYRDLKDFQDEQLSLLHDMDNPTKDKSAPSETYLHSYRVANDVYVFASYIGLSSQVAGNLRWAVLLHDIGKLDVPSEILNKHGRLTDEEFAEMKNHTVYGANRIKNSGINHPLIKLAAEMAMYHHERIDGKGYYGLTGKAIPSRLRLIQLCDIYDAVTAKRAYRPESEQRTVYETMKGILDPHGFLHLAIDMMFARPYCLLKLNLMEGDLSREHHKMLEDYLIHPENYPEEAYAPPVDFMREID